MTGVSGFFDRQGEPSAGRVRFRDTDPRPFLDELDAHARGLASLIPTDPRDVRPVGSRPRDLAREIETGDFEDRTWVIDALDRAARILRELDPD